MAVLGLGLPVGYRFSPTDEELINHYLRLKIEGKDSQVEAIPEVDVCKWEPWDLPSLSVIKNADPEWFFFCPRDQKYPKGRRSNRATEKGYWKATGKDRTIKARSSGMKLIGMKKTLVFHIGRAPGGQRTAWIMHEYRMISEEGPYVLCRLFNKEKEDDNSDEVDPSGASPITTYSSPESMQIEKSLGQRTPESDAQNGEIPAVINKWSDDKSDIITSNTSANEQSYSNSCHASDVEDHGFEFSTIMEDAGQGDYMGFLDGPNFEKLDQVMSVPPLQSKMSTGLGSCYVDPGFGNDVGNNIQNGIVFQDGSTEHDLFDLDFLEKAFNNQEYYDDSPNEKHWDTPSVCMLQQSGESVFAKDSGSATDTDNEVLQVQAFPEVDSSWFDGPIDTNAGFYGEEFLIGSSDLLCDPPIPYGNSLVNGPAPVDSPKITAGTGVKIRARAPRNYASTTQNHISHGSASRRILMQRILGRGSESGDSCSIVKPESTEKTEPTKVEDDIKLETKLSLRTRSKHGVVGSIKATISRNKALSVAVIGVIAAVVVGAWRCLI
ncbi:hypothetical protein ACHQM5_028981 [Ranunculus cassubicifolius]